MRERVLDMLVLVSCLLHQPVVVNAQHQGNRHPFPVIGFRRAGPGRHPPNHIVFLFKGMDLLSQDQHVSDSNRNTARGISNQRPVLAAQRLDASHDAIGGACATPAEQGEQFHRGQHILAGNDLFATADNRNPGQNAMPARIGPACDVKVRNRIDILGCPRLNGILILRLDP